MNDKTTRILELVATAETTANTLLGYAESALAIRRYDGVIHRLADQFPPKGQAEELDPSAWRRRVVPLIHKALPAELRGAYDQFSGTWDGPVQPAWIFAALSRPDRANERFGLVAEQRQKLLDGLREVFDLARPRPTGELEPLAESLALLSKAACRRLRWEDLEDICSELRGALDVLAGIPRPRRGTLQPPIEAELSWAELVAGS